MAQWVKNLLAMLETQEILVQLLVPDDLLEDGMANHSSTLALRILWLATVYVVTKELNITEATEHKYACTFLTPKL